MDSKMASIRAFKIGPIASRSFSDSVMISRPSPLKYLIYSSLAFMTAISRRRAVSCSKKVLNSVSIRISLEGLLTILLLLPELLSSFETTSLLELQ